MVRNTVALGLVVAALASAGLAAGLVPVLKTASAVNGHVVVTFTLTGDLLPGQIVVATSPRKTPSGAFLRSTVRLREDVTSKASAAEVVRYRTRKALAAGTYYVEVSGVETGGVTDCVPRAADCLVHWSNVRKVVVR
jgi:hypothetical protein